MTRYFILDGHTPVEVNAKQWEHWYASADRARRVARDEIAGVEISTVFLGLDHQWEPDGPPLLFETMICAPAYPAIDQMQWRCSTWEEAEAQHQAAIAEARAATLLGDL